MLLTCLGLFEKINVLKTRRISPAKEMSCSGLSLVRKAMTMINTMTRSMYKGLKNSNQWSKLVIFSVVLEDTITLIAQF